MARPAGSNRPSWPRPTRHPFNALESLSKTCSEEHSFAGACWGWQQSFNAIGVPLEGGEPHDPQGGIPDLEKRVLRVLGGPDVEHSAYADDPLRPLPAVSTILPATPAYFTGPGGGVVFDGIMRRHPAGSVFSLMLERELFRSLRQESGLSYAASAAYDRWMHAATA